MNRVELITKLRKLSLDPGATQAEAKAARKRLKILEAEGPQRRREMSATQRVIRAGLRSTFKRGG